MVKGEKRRGEKWREILKKNERERKRGGEREKKESDGFFFHVFFSSESNNEIGTSAFLRNQAKKIKEEKENEAGIFKK